MRMAQVLGGGGEQDAASNQFVGKGMVLWVEKLVQKRAEQVGGGGHQDLLDAGALMQ